FDASNLGSPMASLMLNGAITFPKGLGFPASNLHARPSPPLSLVSNTATRRLSVATRCSSSSSSVSASRPSAQPRFIQHKKEAYWFYRFLSIVYDHIINPGHWTEDMRDDALEPADLSHPDMRVVDMLNLGELKQKICCNTCGLDQPLMHQWILSKDATMLKFIRKCNGAYPRRNSTAV
ncbi:hypothetical protein Bca52824_084842, partial [Brassica carinata]